MTPSIQSMDPSFSVGVSDSTPSSSLLFTRPTMRPPLKNPLRVAARRLSKDETKNFEGTQEERHQQAMKLKRRFLKDKEMTSSFFAKSEARKKVMREVMCVYVFTNTLSYVNKHYMYFKCQSFIINLHCELVATDHNN